MSESNISKKEEQLEYLLTTCEEQQTELESLKIQNESLKSENKQLQDMIISLSQASEELNEAKMIQSSTQMKEKQLKEREKDISDTEELASKQKKEAEEILKSAQKEQDEWENTKRDYLEKMEMKEMDRRNAYSRRVKTHVEKSVARFKGVFAITIIFFLLMGYCCAAYSTSADDIIKLVGAMLKNIEKSGVVIGLLEYIFLLWIPLGVLIWAIVMHFKREIWGAVNYIVFSTTFFIWAVIGYMVTFNSFLLLLYINIGFMAVNVMIHNKSTSY